MEATATDGADSDASAGRSWGPSEGEAPFMQRADTFAVERNRFGFRTTSISDASSLQSGGRSPLFAPLDGSRITGFQRSRHASDARSEESDGRGGDEDAHGADDEHEEEEEDDDEDDDDVRRSWTTEKEPTHGGFSRAMDMASYRFRNEQQQEEVEEREEEEEEEEEEDGDSDASFASLEWVTRQLRQLERRQHDSTGHVGEKENAAHDEVDASVREALSLLNGGDQDEPRGDGVVEETWARSAEQRRDSYFDIVQEAMAAEWRHGDEDDEDEPDEHGGRSEEEPHDDEHYQQTEGNHGEQQNAALDGQDGEADEWLEAYTAKGRVYYYNRRTRESSWTRPETLDRHDEAADLDQNQQHANHEEQEDAYDEEHEDDQNDRHHDEPYEEHRDDYQEDANDNNHQVLEHGDYRVDRHSAQSPASPRSSPKQVQNNEEASPAQVPRSGVLFCCFCGSQVPGSSGLQSHFAACATLLHHKRTSSPLYTQFQQMLVLLSEDLSLRSLHYASSFPDVKPHPIGVEPPAQTEQSVRESLTLLRVKHRSSRKPLVHRVTEHDERIPTYQPVPRLSLSSNGSSKKASKEPREPLSSRYANMKQKPTPVALLNMETCRHCGRSFAEGRLAKHEAVCPRVFGNEHAWGRGPNPSIQKPSATDLNNYTKETQRQDHLLRSLKKKQLKHTLALSFQEHQASLVECPCCRRKFAPSGAQQHIDICKTVQHRPRNPVPLLKDYALAG